MSDKEAGTELPAPQINTVPSEASRQRAALHCSLLLPHYLETQSGAIHLAGPSGIQSAPQSLQSRMTCPHQKQITSKSALRIFQNKGNSYLIKNHGATHSLSYISAIYCLIYMNTLGLSKVVSHILT